MPMPMPMGDESHDDFMARCMAAMADEFEDEAQRAAVCEAQFGKGLRSPTFASKTFTPRIEFKADKPGAITVEFAKLNVIDHDRDVTIPGAFGAQDVRIQQHGHDTASWTIGKGKIKENADTAVLDGLLNLDMLAGKEAHSSLKFDLENGTPLQEWSYIYEVLDADFGEFQGQQVRFLKRLKVHSVDPVFLGAGIGTRTTSVKALNELPYLEFLEDADGLLKELVKRTKSRLEFRGKEGRTLSAANMGRLAEIVASLKSASIDLEQVLADAEPKDDTTALLMAERLKFERSRFRLSQQF